MTHRTTSTPTLRDRQLAQYAASLAAYAATDTVFAESLAASTPRSTMPTTMAYSQNLAPSATLTDRAHATRVGHWLLAQLLDDPQRYPLTRAVLAAYAEQYQEPRDQVFGIVGIAIIGPTLGLIEKKKKKKSQLRVVVDAAWYHSLPAEKQVDTIQRTVLQHAAAELSLAGGKVEQLHPDTADWLMADQETLIYNATPVQLRELQHELSASSLVHTTSNVETELRSIGISPSLSSELVAHLTLHTTY